MDRLRGVRLVLGAALLGLAVHLVVGEKPWEGDAAELLRQGKEAYFLDLARIYRYWISAGNLVVVALLWWSAPRWIGGREAPVDPALAPPPRPGRSFAWLVAVLVLPMPLMLAFQMSRGSIFYPWYAFYALPCWAVLLGIGFETLFASLGAARTRLWSRWSPWRSSGPGTPFSSHEVLRAMRSTPIQESREAVALMRPVRDPLDPANERVLTGSWMRMPFYYDPRVRELMDRHGLRALMEKADASGKELFVT